MKKIQFSDVNKVISSLEEFVKKQTQELNKNGVVIGISGGIDSAVVASLCVNALGPERVLGIFMSEKDSSPKSEYYANLVAQKLNMKLECIDLTSILNSFDIYQTRDSIVKKNFTNFDESCKYRLAVNSNKLKTSQINFPYLEVLDGNNTLHKIKLSIMDYRTLVSATSIKLRVRMIILYEYAEKNNFLVAGTTNKSEYLSGNFVKYGDGGVDFEPITNVFKTQVYQLANHLNIPEEIIQRKASPDTWSLEVSDEEFFFGLSYDIIDLFLYAKENNISIDEIKNSVDLTEEQINNILSYQERRKKLSQHLRELPPNWSPSEI